ncbi:AfsR/SARP family transcriptional regulator [Streptomyces sp. NPDC055210]
MKVRLLGPLELTDGPVTLRLPGEKLRATVAALALSPNRPVSRSDLIDELWGEDLPRNAENSLHGHVARLRRIIDTHTGKDNLRDLIRTSSFGYMLSLPENDIDAALFCNLTRQAATLHRSAPAQAIPLLNQALALWRGPALLDTGQGLISRMAYTRLTETRLTAYEYLFDAELRLGRHREIITELHPLHARYPLRERFCEQLINALYRSGRQAEALDVYHRTRRRLADNLGLEPGDALRAQFERVLRREPLTV